MAPPLVQLAAAGLTAVALSAGAVAVAQDADTPPLRVPDTKPAGGQVFGPIAKRAPALDPELRRRVERLVGELAADTEAARDAAREELLALAGDPAVGGPRLLDLLPPVSDAMPPAIRGALQSLRRDVTDRLADESAAATRVTLDVVQEPLSDVLRQIEEQTGNRVVDQRGQLDQAVVDRPVTVELKDVPFWEAIDQVLDEAGLDIYPHSGEPSLALTARQRGAAPRWAAAAYAGPFRIEAVNINASRNLRRTGIEGLNLQLEIAWEPRLAPIAFSQQLADLEAENENGLPLPMTRVEGSIDLEAPATSQAMEITLPLKLPSRDSRQIASLRGELQAVVPGPVAEFRFNDLDKFDKPVTQQRGAAAVTLVGVRESGGLWEVEMRLRIEGAEGDGGSDNAFASHRGWVFNNKSLLVTGDGEEVEDAGLENTMQRGNEIGVLYPFVLPDGVETLEGMTWVYRTPTAVLRFPVEYELNHIPLP